jgi:DNA-binding transcriptional regulator GbsR (MarR family)
MTLSEKNFTFVMHCGEMGSRWGFNRTIGQMCGLLIITKNPMTANEIADSLSISRGNVSMGIKVQHIPGDRKEYYAPAGDIWDMANRVFEERKKREIDPTLSLLRDNLLDEANNEEEVYAQKQMEEIHNLLETVTKWSSELQRLTPEQLNKLMKLGSGIGKVIDLKDKIFKKE